jgi:hypothetical protein
MPMIPIESMLTDEQLKSVKERSIPDRQKDLKKCRYGDIEMSLWLMGEIQHLKLMVVYNEEQRLGDPL